MFKTNTTSWSSKSWQLSMYYIVVKPTLEKWVGGTVVGITEVDLTTQVQCVKSWYFLFIPNLDHIVVISRCSRAEPSLEAWSPWPLYITGDQGSILTHSSTSSVKKIAIRATLMLIMTIRDRGRLKNRQIFGKVQNSLCPPPSFLENQVAFFWKSLV